MLSSIAGLVQLHNRDIVNKIDVYSKTYESNENIENYSHYIENNTLLEEIQEEFKSESSRLTWIKNSPFYVEPITIKLDDDAEDEDGNVDILNFNNAIFQEHNINENLIDDFIREEDDDNDDTELTQTREELFHEYRHVIKGKKASFQYIPILKTLTALFKHPDIIQAYFDSIENQKPELNIFYQSQSFKKNELFQINFGAIQLKFFVDGYSNCNPLAHARKKFKVTPAAFKIGNLHRRFHSVDYFTQVLIN